MLKSVLAVALFAGLAMAQNGQSPAPPAQTPSAAQPSQAAQAPSQPSIKVQVNEVIVPVTVTDDKGRFVSNLDAKDFRVQDEGKDQKIRFFTRDRNQPVVVGLLVDMSNYTRLHWKNFQDAAIEMALNL